MNLTQVCVTYTKMNQRIYEGQSDGFNSENQVARTNTMSSRETLEIRDEFQKLYENVIDENSVHDSNSASTVSVEETIGNLNEIQIAEIRKGLKILY